MNFLFQLYTDVAAWQLFGGWVLAGFLFIWLGGVCLLTQSLIDKARSLEARIDKLISRPRAKNGRFEKKDKG